MGDGTEEGCCGEECSFEDYNEPPAEPCWGTVTVVDEQYGEGDYWWIHACEGHQDVHDGGAYRPKPEVSDAS